VCDSDSVCNARRRAPLHFDKLGERQSGLLNPTLTLSRSNGVTRCYGFQRERFCQSRKAPNLSART
jgi:hypothetical protein